MSEFVYVATVQVAVKAQSQEEACDAIRAALTDFASQEPLFIDWGYLRLGGQYLYPSLQSYIDLDRYKEGDFLA